MIAELLIFLPLALKKGGGNGVVSTYGVTQTEGSTSNLAGNDLFKLGKIETISQPLIIPTFDYTTAYIEGATGKPESIHDKLKGGRL
tara:strand:- start:86 stop:346 length:261 start_codon:yes stop_codon:yes gene_type:complete